MDQQKDNNTIKNKNENSHGAIKKTINRKAPVIKQTLTSMYRIAKANPLLLVKDDKIEDSMNDFGITNIKLPKSILQPNTRNTYDNTKQFKPEHSVTSAQKTAFIKPADTANARAPGLRCIPLTRTSSLRITVTRSTNDKMSLQRTGSLKMPNPKFKNNNRLPNVSSQTPQVIVKPSSVVTNSEAAKSENTNKTKQRRSLSAEHYERKRKLTKPKIEQHLQKREITQSLSDIQAKSIVTAPFVSPIPEEKKVVTFKTPSAYNRRSIHQCTPTPFNKAKYRPSSTPKFASTPGPAFNDLRSRLEEWLRKHKKPVHNYHHLKCFGLKSNQAFIKDEENKENIEEPTVSNSYEDLKISSNSVIVNTPLSLEPEQFSTNDIRSVTRTALHDLLKLILDGYYHEQCEAWLGLIRQKYRHLEEEPQYWECRAAIEQTRGNITSAVECLRTAIVQGAEVKAVDHSLEQLLQKFSLLNISTSESSFCDEDKARKDRAKIVLDARNVFKSSIIQFAVQERTLKKKQVQGDGAPQTNYVVTPVRRSTRINRSKYILTPGVQLCSSLQELDDGVRLNLDFRGNKALSPGSNKK